MNIEHDCPVVIFDMDGVLLDSERIVMRAFLEVSSQLGYDISDETYLLTVGRNRREITELVYEKISPDFPLDKVRVRVREMIRKELPNGAWPLKPGVQSILATLSKREVPIGVATSSSLEEATHRLSGSSLLPFFRSVTGGNEVEVGKPAPDIFLLAAKRLGVEPERCFVVEDSDYGVTAASAAGMRCILVPDLKEPTSETERLVERVFRSLHEVEDYLVRLVSRSP